MIVLPLLPNYGPNAFAFWPFTFVRWSRRKDAALLAHEAQHGEDQMPWSLAWALCVGVAFAIAEHIGLQPSLHWLWVALACPWYAVYHMNERFRLWVEVRGFKAEIAARGISREYAAWKLSRDYRLRVSYEEVYALLK